jgi:flagellar basal body-associated protein FliL
MNQDLNNMNSTGMPTATPVNNMPNPGTPVVPESMPQAPVAPEPVAPPVQEVPQPMPEPVAPAPVNPAPMGGFVTPPAPEAPTPVTPEPIMAAPQPMPSPEPLAPVQEVPQPMPAQPAMPGVAVPGEEPQKKKMSPILVILIIVVLTAIGIGLGYFLFTKFGPKPNEGTKDNEPVEVTPVALSNNAITNNGVDATELSKVLVALGISQDSQVANNEALNYYVTNPNYQDNAKDIIDHYVAKATFSEVTLPEGYNKEEDEKCGTGCTLITQEDAEAIMKLYNLGGELTDYFVKDEMVENAYGFNALETYVISVFNAEGAGSTHNLSAEYVEESMVLTDSQTVKTVAEDGTLNEETKTAIYTFNKNDEGTYYLYQVEVN